MQRKEDEENDLAVKNQIKLAGLKSKIQVNNTKITAQNLEFEPPEILNLENIKNIEMIKDINDQNKQNADGKDNADDEYGSDVSLNDSYLQIEDDMRQFTVKDFHLKAQ